MSNYKQHIKNKISNKDPWYTSLHFEWAHKEDVKRIFAKRRKIFIEIVEREILKKGTVSLLDYGCGDGYWSKVFSDIQRCKVIGVDYNGLRLRRAGEYVPNAEFIELDLRSPENNIAEKFDIVFCSQVIEHIEDDISFLKIIRKYLKPDGLLILGTTNEGCFTQRSSRNKSIEPTDHVHFYVEKEIRRKILNAGFTVKRTHREVFFPGSYRIYNKLLSKDWGFKLLEVLSVLCPSQCSDYYFECKIAKE